VNHQPTIDDEKRRSENLNRSDIEIVAQEVHPAVPRQAENKIYTTMLKVCRRRLIRRWLCSGDASQAIYETDGSICLSGSNLMNLWALGSVKLGLFLIGKITIKT
jgi:hypothetical protein